MRQEIWRNALAIVLDGDLELRLDATHIDVDTTLCRRELDGVVHEIPQDLLQPARVGEHFADRRIDRR